MARKKDWRMIVETGRPFLLIALEYLIRRNPAAPGATAFQLLGSAVEHLVPNTQESKLVGKIRKTHRRLQQIDPADTIAIFELKQKLSKQLNRL